MHITHASYVRAKTDACALEIKAPRASALHAGHPWGSTYMEGSKRAADSVLFSPRHLSASHRIAGQSRRSIS